MTPKSVLSILKEGIIISTRFNTKNTWYRNIVYKVKNNLVYIALDNSFLQNLILVGSSIVFKYATEYFEYVFEGVVSDIIIDHPAHIVIQINKSEEIINTRAFPRYDTYLAANIKPFDESEPYFSIVTNISLSGMAFIAKHDFAYSEENEIKVLLPSEHKIYGKGKIIRKSSKIDFFDYSMQFTDMDDENNNYLSEYLLKLEDDRASYHHNFEKTIKGKL